MVHRSVIEIRRLEMNEYSLIAELFNKYRIFYKKESDVNLGLSFLKERFENSESITFIASADKQPIAYTQLYPKYSSARLEKNWILNDLYVEESFRNLGIGESLIMTALNFAKSSGSVSLHISTQISNTRAQRLYEKLGFIKLKPDQEFYDYKLLINKDSTL